MNLINIPHENGIRLVLHEHIIRVQGLSNYSKIYFADGRHLTVAKVLHWFEDHLPPQMFARVHRSHLVNKLFVHEINGTNYNNLQLTNGDNIAMSRRKRGALMKN